MENEKDDYGIVQEITSPDTAKVLITSTGNCNACLSKTNCNIHKSENRTINAKFESDIKIGDKVLIQFDGRLRIIYSILIFLVPLISMILFYLISNFIFKKESLSITFSFIGLILSFLIIFIIMKTNKKLSEFKPLIVKK